MTSTSFNIGFSGTEKSSSRVLRPPGGGHSDIFGIREKKNDIITPSKRRNQPQSSIGSCFGMEDKAKQEPKVKVATDAQESFENGVNKEVDNVTDENQIPKEQIKEKEVEKKEVPKRGRVPPGGYSTRLW